MGADFTRDGDQTYLRASVAKLVIVDTKSGAQRPVWPQKRTFRNATWAPDGARLAMLLLENDAWQVTIWDRVSGKVTAAKIPAGRYVAENSELRWTKDGSALVFAARTDAWKADAKAKFAALTTAPIVALDGKDDFLEWDGMNRLSATRSIVSWTPATGVVTTLVPETRIGSWTLAEDGKSATIQEDITKKTDYDVIGGREWKLVAYTGGAPRTLLASTKNTQITWAEDGVHYATGRDGKVFLGTTADTNRRQLLGPTGAPAPGAEADTSAAARAKRDAERFTAMIFTGDGSRLLAENSTGLWVVDVASGTKEQVVTYPDTALHQPRPLLVTWSRDGRYLVTSENSRTQWDRAFTLHDLQSKRTRAILRGTQLLSGARLAREGTTMVMSIADGNHPVDLFVTDLATADAPRKLVESNPQLATKPIAKTELLPYLDADGKSRFGVVRYPTNYVKGTRYPTVFIIYEDFFDDSFDAVANLLAAHGYAVVNPSVGFDIGYPGEAWIKGVTAAANAVIAMGLADSSRLGVHGTSYGGYATNLLVTQTGRFKAAINMSGKVDFISFYTDSPRLGVRNIHAAEKSQDRIGATMWQQPQKYVQHSAIMFADRITTPLLLMTGGEDHNVPALNTREMYYALRRLGKTVTWVNYTNSGHGVPQTTESDFVDYHQRVLDWYAKYLAPAKKATTSSGAGQ
jgi:dipeptidyl aminopeptidase/acylaminoacyl peptidase